MTPLTHPIVNAETGECGDPACECHYFAAQSPLAPPWAGNWHMKSLEPEPKNVPEGNSEPVEAVPAPDFEREWAEAPRAMVNYVERDIAEYWFLRGMRAGEVKGLTESTEAFRAMAEQRGLGR